MYEYIALFPTFLSAFSTVNIALWQEQYHPDVKSGRKKATGN